MNRQIEILCRAYRVDLFVASAEVTRICRSKSDSASEAIMAVLWAAALPSLAGFFSPPEWADLVDQLHDRWKDSTTRLGEHDTSALLINAELGLTLSWGLDLPPAAQSPVAPSPGEPSTGNASANDAPIRSLLDDCGPTRGIAVRALDTWVDGGEHSITAALTPLSQSRLVAASLHRCVMLGDHLAAESPRPRPSRRAARRGQLGRLGVWVAAATTNRLTTALCDATAEDMVDDYGDGGLLRQLARWSPETLVPAVDAATGVKAPGGRLEWEASLPEAFHHDWSAKVALMMPAWDVRRGRVHLDYRGTEMTIEIYAGKTPALAGPWEVDVEIDGKPIQPTGPWAMTREQTDDEVHSLEFEQPWSGGVVVQRHVMILREDRCVMLSDTVRAPEASVSSGDRSPSCPEGKSIRYQSRLPLATPGVAAEETREIFLCKPTAARDSGDGVGSASPSGKRIATLIPLDAGEWKAERSDTKLQVAPDGRLTLSATGRDRLFTPLWADLQTRRCDQMRTWRQLTVAEDFRLVNRNEAVGYRVQVGSEQWVIYRSLVSRPDGRANLRSMLGNHLTADFFCGRFDGDDDGGGDVDILITMGTNDDDR